MIQIITCSEEDYSFLRSEPNIKINDFSVPESIDVFKICIYDLSNSKLWENESTTGNTTFIRKERDLELVGEMIQNSTKSKIIILLPKNLYFMNKNSLPVSELKNIKLCFIGIVEKATQIKGIDLNYERTETVVSGEKLEADFYFKNTMSSYSQMTKSIGGEKTTTLVNGNFTLTTLQILENKDSFYAFLNKACSYENCINNEPEWIKEYMFFNDEELTGEKYKKNEKINELEKKIVVIDEQLENNSKYKKILYETGEELVKIVTEIVENLLDCSTEDFIDEKKEDLLVKLNEVTFIIEIKGVTSNIKSENVAQLERHCQSYIDKLNETGENETVKGVLLINHQRNKKLEVRDIVHDTQIDLAKKYGSIIIETKTLLDIFEDFKNEKISSEECVKLFDKEIGLLKYTKKEVGKL